MESIQGLNKKNYKLAKIPCVRFPNESQEGATYIKNREKLWHQGKRKCKVCNEIKPIDSFYFNTKFKTKKGKKIGAYRLPWNMCKNCYNKQKKDWYAKNTTRIKKLRTMKYAKEKGTPQRTFLTCKHNSRKRKHPFNVTVEFFKKFIDKPCFYCGALPPKGRLLGIDRKINSIGYADGNCVPCCYPCNHLKIWNDKDEFLERVFKIADYRREATSGINPKPY